MIGATPELSSYTQPQPESLLRLPEVIRRTGLCRARIYTRMQAGTFPSSIKVDTSTMWVESEINAWVHEQIAASRAPEKKKPTSVKPKRAESAAV